ncbi:28S ribosomal protein S31, mitochondrial isoform X1 [Schistocerca nitens]|uniref:28S ribosomal protein S31, mitochondrial isoform X1 n=1 Tax=Schistocerca nitens TaxID=7011 RepID=UPI0021177E3A|nr:28S ribosomal protein S31, mitochondrial isoform X1 [Schistocerca nitens]
MGLWYCQFERQCVLRILQPLRQGEKTIFAFFSTKKDGTESSDDESDKKKTLQKDNKSRAALEKLNTLIQSMVKEEQSSQGSSYSGDKFAKPKRYFVKKEKLEKQIDAKHTSEEKVSASPVEKAAKEVAEALGGDTKKTESELLNKLLSHSAEVKQGSSGQQESKPALDLSELIAGMKIDRTKKPSPHGAEETSRAHQVRRILGQQPPQQPPAEPLRRTRDTGLTQPRVERVDLFGAEPLGIFKVDATKTAQPSFDLETWTKLQQRELRLAVLHPPKNIFEEMILWTEQGKLWKFPVDNEQGLEDEAKVPFTDHVFLEHYLEPWCPKRGPIRHFMELVCVGLSKNSFVTAEEKRKHIEWYRDYFASKKDLLEEVGALG